ncbi:MAG: radical SAM protein [Thermofilum sp.]
MRERVARGSARKYYRFRGGRWYGGIATADCVGCNLRCVFCWGSHARDNFASVGVFLEPEEVYARLARIAEKRGYDLVRISGNEPTLAWQHLLRVLELFEEDGRFRFVLETNGITLGADRGKARDLSKFSCVHVRVSLKGASEEEFHLLTGARPEFYAVQLNALRNLLDYGVSCHPAVMLSFSAPDSADRLKERLTAIDPVLVREFEEEYVFLYRHVVEQLRRAGLKPRVAYAPDSIPPELV